MGYHPPGFFLPFSRRGYASPGFEGSFVQEVSFSGEADEDPERIAARPRWLSSMKCEVCGSEGLVSFLRMAQMWLCDVCWVKFWKVVKV